MGKPAEKPARAQIVRDIAREVEARRGTITNAEIFELLARVPPPPGNWSSADVIRELRGPLPGDDSDLENAGRH